MLRRLFVGLTFALSSSLLGAGSAAGDDAELGRPFLRVYEPLDFDVGSQILSVAQDGRGLLYFAAGTSYKLLEYDGERWRHLPLDGPVIDLATDAEGRIWVAASQDFGYLEPVDGTARFVSLADRFPDGGEPLGRLRRIVVADDGVWFASRRELVRCAGDEVTVWTTSREAPLAPSLRSRASSSSIARGPASSPGPLRRSSTKSPLPRVSSCPRMSSRSSPIQRVGFSPAPRDGSCTSRVEPSPSSPPQPPDRSTDIRCPTCSASRTEASR